MGPKPKSTVLTPTEEAVIVECRRRTLLPLDDVLSGLRDTIPNLSRSALHRCLQRHQISRRPAGETTEKRKRFKTYEIGYVHIDSCELSHADGKRVMFLAIDRVSKFTYVEFHESAGKTAGSAFLRNVIAAFPYKIHKVLTDNGMAFADLPKNREGPTRRFLGSHIFDRICLEHGIEHRLTKPYHPWTNGQAERMNRTVKDATIKTFHYETSKTPRPMSWLSSPPTTSPNTSRHSNGKHPSRASVMRGQPIRLPLKSTRTTSSRDHTPSPTPVRRFSGRSIRPAGPMIRSRRSSAITR
jgi:transposase-like protein